jgi:hypothetical protein
MACIARAEEEALGTEQLRSQTNRNHSQPWYVCAISSPVLQPMHYTALQTDLQVKKSFMRVCRKTNICVLGQVVLLRVGAAAKRSAHPQ